MNRIDVIQAIIDHRSLTSYLEIGCYQNEAFNQVRCEKKVGVDPVQGGTHRMTSDEFFVQNHDVFDLIFIDGYHHHDQVMRDVKNSLVALSTHGALVLHDCNPPTLSHEGQAYCGTAWRAFAHLRTDPFLRSAVFDFDFGVGVIFKENNPSIATVPIQMDDMTYNDLLAHRHDWLNLMQAPDVQSFIRVGQ